MLAHFRVKGIEKQNIALLSPYGVQTPEELTALAQNYRERRQAADKAAHETEVIQNAVTERQGKRDGAKQKLLDFVHGFAPEVKDMFGCSAALSRALSLEHDLSLARERASASRRRLDDLEAQGPGARRRAGTGSPSRSGARRRPPGPLPRPPAGWSRSAPS